MNARKGERAWVRSVTVLWALFSLGVSRDFRVDFSA